MITTVDLQEIGALMGDCFPAVEELWLFGSRRYRTRSVRSDIDLLVKCADHVRSGDLRRFAMVHCPALDLFLVTGGKAVSVANDSYVEADSFGELCARIDAVCVWSRNDCPASDGLHKQEVREDIEYRPTTLDGGEPRIGDWGSSLTRYFEEVQAQRLPVRPFIGDSVTDIADYIVALFSETIGACRLMMARATRASWSPCLTSEYDVQDAFYLAVKPWIPELAREETTVRFDNQDKNSDFSLLDGRIVIEMKYVKDKSTKAAVAKTLSGLRDFYERNPALEVLLFLIAAERDSDVDPGRWSAEFSSNNGERKVITSVCFVS